MSAHRLVIGLLIVSVSSWAGQYLITTFAGGAPPLTPVPATQASIGDPPRVAADSAGSFYFGSLHSVFRVDSQGTLTRIAGNGRSGYRGDGGIAANAQLMYPEGIAVDPAGAVYVSDREANVIRKISGGVIVTFATGLRGPTGIAFDKDGNLYVADTLANAIRKISPSGAVTTAVGSGAAGFAGDGGAALSASLNQPQGVALDADGNLFIADTFNNRVRKIAHANWL